MKQILFSAALALSLHAAHAAPLDHVNPLMGTASKPELSNGNTYPAIGLPWGMNYWTPQTGKMGNGWTYTYDADRILMRGARLEFDMALRPNKKRGTAAADAPYSFSTDPSEAR